MLAIVDPFTEYNELLNREAIRDLSKSVEELIEASRTGTLLSYFVDEQEVREKINLRRSKIISDSIKLSLFGELCFSGVLREKRHPTEYFIRAARNYQKILELSKDFMSRQEEYLLTTLSALDFHNGNQHASAAILAGRALQLLGELKPPETLHGMFNLKLHTAILKFLKSDFNNLIEEVRTVSEEIKRVLENCEELTENDILDFGCILYILRSLELLSQFMINGSVEIESILENINKATDVAYHAGRPDLLYFARKLDVSIKSLLNLSLWKLAKQLEEKVLKRRELIRYVQEKIKNGVYFLYPSQIYAIDRGLLDEERAVISMPTGAGKTLLAELILLYEFLKYEGKILAVYMVPSRALAHEKFEEFKKSFDIINIKTAQITGDVVLETEELIRQHDLLIVTPEKFDMLLRSRFYGANVSCLIVDEFHNIRSGYRGIRIQANIIRFTQLYPDAKIVLISAVAPNLKDVEDWLDASRFEIKWRPTFSRIGIFETYNGKKIEFSDGTTRQIVVEEKIRGYRKFVPKIALQFSREGPCMIFCPAKRDVEEYAKLMVEELEESKMWEIKINKESLKRYKSKLERLLGKSEEIYEYFVKGVGVHQGDMPHEIRRIIEGAVKDSAIPFLVSTTTLAEGVNLPIKTIIIPKPKVGREEMELCLFFNLLGRAGRPWKEVEGQVILVSHQRVDRDILNKYLRAKSEDVEPIETPIMRIIEIEDKNPRREEWEENEIKMCYTVLTTVLLAALIEGVIDKICDDKLIEKLTIGRQDIKEEVAKVLKNSEKILVQYGCIQSSTPTEFGRIVYKTGFSPESCYKLCDQLFNLELLESLKFPDGDKKEQKQIISTILNLLQITNEAKMYFPRGLPQRYQDIIFDWINGELLQNIARRYFRGKLSEAMIKVQGYLSGLCAWFFYAVSLLADYIGLGRRISNALRNLAEYAWFGTTNPIAIAILKRDVSRELLRDDVLRVIEHIGYKEALNVIKDPSVLKLHDIKSKIKEAIKQSDKAEFIDKLYKILAS